MKSKGRNGIIWQYLFCMAWVVYQGGGGSEVGVHYNHKHYDVVRQQIKTGNSHPTFLQRFEMLQFTYDGSAHCHNYHYAVQRLLGYIVVLPLPFPSNLKSQHLVVVVSVSLAVSGVFFMNHDLLLRVRTLSSTPVLFSVSHTQCLRAHATNINGPPEPNAASGTLPKSFRCPNTVKQSCRRGDHRTFLIF